MAVSFLLMGKLCRTKRLVYDLTLSISSFPSAVVFPLKETPKKNADSLPLSDKFKGTKTATVVANNMKMIAATMVKRFTFLLSPLQDDELIPEG